RLFAAKDLELHFIADLVVADFLDQLIGLGDRLAVDALHDVVDHQSGLGGWSVVADAEQAHAVLAVFAEDVDVNGRAGLGRQAHPDFFAIDDGEEDIGILAEVIDTDAAQLRRGQAPGELVPGLAAVGGLIEARARAP